VSGQDFGRSPPNGAAALGYAKFFGQEQKGVQRYLEEIPARALPFARAERGDPSFLKTSSLEIEKGVLSEQEPGSSLVNIVACLFRGAGIRRRAGPTDPKRLAQQFL
jgi:hypothetical protein